MTQIEQWTHRHLWFNLLGHSIQTINVLFFAWATQILYLKIYWFFYFFSSSPFFLFGESRFLCNLMCKYPNIHWFLGWRHKEYPVKYKLLLLFHNAQTFRWKHFKTINKQTKKIKTIDSYANFGYFFSKKKETERNL